MAWITVVNKETKCRHDCPSLRPIKHVAPGSVYECERCGQRFVVSRSIFGRYYARVKDK